MRSLLDTGPAPFVPLSFNMAQHVLARSVARAPDKTALHILSLDHSESWTYAQLEAAVLGVAAGLQERGLQPGDRILMRLGSQIAFPLLFLGALAAGMVPVATSAQLTQAEITPMAARIAPRLIVASPGVALPEGQTCPVLSDAELRAMEACAPAAYHQGAADRPGYIIFTSGTSGTPMAVVHAHRAILARQTMHRAWEGLGESDRLLHAGAFNWTYTLGTGLMDPWTVGATALIPATGVGPAHLGALLRDHHASLFAAAPGVLRQMLRSGLPALPHLRHGLSAGEKLSPEVRAGWTAATGTPLCEALGMSEISTFISESPERPAPLGATGFLQPGRRIAALGPDLLPVPRGTPGQLAIDRRDPGLMLGYLDAPEATAARLTPEWFLTGDSIRIDTSDAITYLGRDDDQMNAGGYRVSPLEVEAAMARFPGLTETAVTEVEVKPGVTVIACFYTAPDPCDPQALAAHAAAHLARYKQPRLFHHLPALPRGANSKLNRRALRALRLP